MIRLDLAMKYSNLLVKPASHPPPAIFSCPDQKTSRQKGHINSPMLPLFRPVAVVEKEVVNSAQKEKEIGIALVEIEMLETLQLGKLCRRKKAMQCPYHQKQLKSCSLNARLVMIHSRNIVNG